MNAFCHPWTLYSEIKICIGNRTLVTSGYFTSSWNSLEKSFLSIVILIFFFSDVFLIQLIANFSILITISSISIQYFKTIKIFINYVGIRKFIIEDLNDWTVLIFNSITVFSRFMENSSNGKASCQKFKRLGTYSLFSIVLIFELKFV